MAAVDVELIAGVHLKKNELQCRLATVHKNYLAAELGMYQERRAPSASPPLSKEFNSESLIKTFTGFLEGVKQISIVNRDRIAIIHLSIVLTVSTSICFDKIFYDLNNRLGKLLDRYITIGLSVLTFHIIWF